MKNPILVTLVVILISFCLSVGILYSTHPTWIEVLETKSGKTHISWHLLLLYSATFSVVIGLMILILMSKPHTKSSLSSPSPSSFYAKGYQTGFKFSLPIQHS